MIAAVTTVRNEAAIIAKTVGHLLGEGVGLVIVSDGYSIDGTRDVLAGLPVTVLDQDGPLDQAVEMLRLSLLAAEQGAEWVVPFDADEFWHAEGESLAEFFAHVPETTGKVWAAVYGHRDWDHRFTAAKLGKVAFRPQTLRSIAWGNHDADVDGFAEHGLVVRELQYQSFAHFLAKIEKARELYESSDFPESYGSHMRRLVAMSDVEREAEWQRIQSAPVVFDPIPTAEVRP